MYDFVCMYGRVSVLMYVWVFMYESVCMFGVFVCVCMGVYV